MGGLKVFDVRNPYEPKYLTSVRYNGRIYGSEIQRGFDVFELDGFSSRSPDTVNAQTQERF